MKQDALVLVDIQNIYFTEGSWKLEKEEEAAKSAKKILEYYRKENLPVIHVKHRFHPQGYQQTDEYLNAIHEMVAPQNGEIVVEKDFPNSFLRTELNKHLEELQIKSVTIVGMMTHMCIDTTVRACMDYGYQVTVIEDACTTKPLQHGNVVVPTETVNNVYMASWQGKFAKVVSSEEFLKMAAD